MKEGKRRQAGGQVDESMWVVLERMNVYTTRLAAVDAVASKGNALVDEEKNLSPPSAAVETRAEAVTGGGTMVGAQ